MPIFRKKHPEIITYLDCYSENGWVYRVTGQAMGYSVELQKGSQCFVMAEYSDLSEAHNMALWLLDNGAVPEQLHRQPAEFREQPCI